MGDTNLSLRAPRRVRGGGSGGCVVESLEGRRLMSAGSPAVIDVMVLYTPGAAVAPGVGGAAGITARVSRAIADTNVALANSGVNATVRLAYEGPVSYGDSGVINTDLVNLQQGRGGLSGVAALRNRYGADLVSLWVGSGDEAGRAFQPDGAATAQAAYGFNVVQARYAVDNFIFAHEVGHNLGAGHDRGDPTPRNIPYAYGKTFYLGTYQVGDLMSDGGVERIGYYSNPNVSYLGVATGNADSGPAPADNARVMNTYAPMVANYRSSVTADTRAPWAALDEVVANPAQKTLTVKVQYADETAVLASSVGTGDVVVGGPGGFSRVATFVGLDVNGDGAQRVATYRVDISGYTADPNAYWFTVQAGQVQDVYGHVSGAGTLGAPGNMFANRAGPRLASAFNVGGLDGTAVRFNNWIDGNSPTAFYRFTLGATQPVTATLSGLSGNVDEILVKDANSDGRIQSGEILAYPRRAGMTPETISMTLGAGTYYLWVAPPTGGIGSSYTLKVSAGAVGATPVPTSPPTAPPPTAPGVPSGSIAGTVFNDLTANGARDLGDAGLYGWQVYVDLNNNNRLDAGEANTITDYQGNYRLGNLAAGAYIVRATLRSGWRQTTPINNWGVHVTLGGGQNLTGASFGETQRV